MQLKTPMQKLVRLKTINARLREIYFAGNAFALSIEVQSLEHERDTILASVGAPPLELIGEGDAHKWAAAFSQTFPGIDTTDVYAWFANAILAGYEAGNRDGFHEGQADAGKGADGMAAMLAMIESMLDRGIVRAQRIKLEDADEARTLAELIEDVLKKAGRK